MLEQVDALPRPEPQPAFLEREREVRLGERRPQVGGHVVRTFLIMLVGH